MSVTLPCLRKNCAALSVIALKKMISARLQQVCRTLTWCHLKRCFYFFFLKYAVPGFVFLRAFFLFFLLNQTFLSGLLRRKPILVSLREKCAHSPLLDRKKKKVFSFFVPLLHCFKRFCSRKRCFARLQKVTLVLALLHSKRC